MRAAFRLTRATVFAVVCAVVSAGCHALSGHATLTPAALTAGVSLALALGYVLAGRERSLPVILAAMLTGEAGLHLLFGALAPAADAPAPVPAAPAMAGHAMAEHTAAHGGLTMVLAHLWAGLLASWWLHRGERAVWSLLRRLGARLAGRLLPAAPITRSPYVPPTGLVVVAPSAHRIRYCLVERGPPPVRA